jgi:ABC-type tungstate transport system permease subunit
LVASTISVGNSGRLGYLVPIFTTETGIEVRVLAQGTGQAAATGAHGDADLVLVHDRGDPRLLNRYDVVLLDPKKHPEAKQEPARRFADWLASPVGQAAVGAYKVDGEQLFHPSAAAPK